MKLCGREECIYQFVHKMIDNMKKDLAERQSIALSEQIIVARIYEITANILSEACRNNFKIDKKDCDPSALCDKEKLTLDTFILLNQLKEDGYITEEYKKILFDSLVKIKPEMEKVVKDGESTGLI